MIQDLHLAMITFVAAMRAMAGNLISIEKRGLTSNDLKLELHLVIDDLVKHIFNTYFSNACSCEMVRSEGEYDSSRNDSVIGDTTNLAITTNGKFIGSSSNVIAGSINVPQEATCHSSDRNMLDKSDDPLRLSDPNLQNSGFC